MDWSALLRAVELIFGGALGGTVGVFGLSRWLGDAWLGRILDKEKAKYAKEIEKLKARKSLNTIAHNSTAPFL